MVPATALIPRVICPPSKAGPEAHEQQVRIPPFDREISVLVPMSTPVSTPG